MKTLSVILSVLVLIVLTEALVTSGNGTTQSHIHPYGTPLSIMEFTTNETVTVNYTAIDTIFLQDEVKNRKIVVISIIGAFRKGKSFFMDYCLRFMYAHYKSVNFPNNTLANKGDWYGPPEAPLIGFSWKAGPHRHTSGIIMWSDIFLHEDLAIILMDTQGLFDAKTSPADNSRIFALGTLVSSLQIFNLNDVIQENQLEYLQMATDYANFVAKAESTKSKPFQNLMFLIRDWASNEDFPFGRDGGSLYLAEVLQIKPFQSAELKAVRNYIKSSFENVNCFLMPHPGLALVRDHSYDGRFSRLGDEFQDNLKQLLEWMLDSNNLKIKTVLGSEVTGHDFNGYFKSYFEKFQSPDIPKIPSIYQATIERQYANFLDRATNEYKSALKKYQPSYNSTNFEEALEKLHKNCSHLVMLGYDQQKKMGSLEHEKQHRVILEKNIKALYDQWKQGMLDTYNTIYEVEARNKVVQQTILADSEARYKNVTAKLEAEKQDLIILQQAREKQIKLNEKLKDEEKEEALKKIRDEMKEQNIRFEKVKEQIKANKTEEYESILKDIENRRKEDEDAMNKTIKDREKLYAEFQLKLKQERDEALKLMKEEHKQRDIDRQKYEERRAKEDAATLEELRSLSNRLDKESKDRMRQLEIEKEDRAAERNLLNKKLEQERWKREEDRNLQERQFKAEIEHWKRHSNNAATTTSANLFFITFAVGVFSVFMFHK